MKTQLKKSNTIFKAFFNMLVDLPTPSSISYMWNWGSILSLMMMIQILTGILLASHYAPNTEMAFNSIIHISREVNMGWLLRFIHMNGAAMFFIIIYIHISRGMLFSCYKNIKTWGSGLLLLFLLMGTAFMGYVLPWGQMSFWGATVITNLVSAIPYLGKAIVEWLWGGFSVGNATLNRFFMLHFLLPFILALILVIHLVFLHETGSKNPVGSKSNLDKMSFHPFFSSKDSLGTLILVSLLITLSLIFPFSMGDPENFNPANPLNTPIHIQPEWYFLFAYAILRSIPNKLGGVIALILSIIIIMVLPFKNKMFSSNKMNMKSKFMFWMMSASFIILTWIGANPVEHPFEMIGQMTSILYFITITSI